MIGSDQERLNIVLVTVDSLRADRCGFMGSEKGLTPTLDSLAEDGIVFENAIAPGPATPESMPVIFTGSYPAPLGDDNHTELERERRRISHHMSARENLAEQLSAHGYTTAAFTPNPFTSRFFNFDKGFDHFEDFMEGSRVSRGMYHRVFEGFVDESRFASSVRPIVNLLQGEEVFRSWESFDDEVVRWANQAKQPYFLWVMLLDAHNPYLVPKQYRSQSAWAMWHSNWRMFREHKQSPFPETVERRLVLAYDDSVRYTDAFFDRITGAIDDAVFVVTSDHGEAFGEHGSYGHEPFLHPENVHVPLVISKGPEAWSGQVDRPFSLASMPDLIRSIIARDQQLGGLTDEYVVSRTYKGDRVAFYGDGWRYVENEQGGTLLSNGPTSEEDTEIAERLCRDLSGTVRHDVEERVRIVDGVTSLDYETGL